MTRGQRFDEKYSVEKFQSYKCDPDTLVIPMKGHALFDDDGHTTFDEGIVQEIDRDGVFVGTVVVWTDIDRGKLFVVEGRGNVFNVREVNRRRKERGDEPIQIRFMPLDVDLDRAVEHVRLRNFHRKVPSLSHYAREVARLQRLGKSWARIIEILHVDGVTDPEQWCRKRLPLGYCIPSVAAAIDAGEFPLAVAREFAGGKIDGSERLGEKEQEKLLEEMRQAKTAAKDKPKPVAAKARERVVHALSNGESKNLKSVQGAFARFTAAVISRLDGDVHAFDDVSDTYAPVVEIIEQAIKKPEKVKPERPKKAAKKAKKAESVEAAE